MGVLYPYTLLITNYGGYMGCLTLFVTNYGGYMGWLYPIHNE